MIQFITRTSRVASCALILLGFGLLGVTPAKADWVTDAIYAAAARYGVSGDYLVNVAMCESNLDPGAVGIHGEQGLFQFDPGTWWAYGGGDIWSVYEQADKAAWMFSQGLNYLWLCA